jgi:STE24 endopeptidase
MPYIIFIIIISIIVFDYLLDRLLDYLNSTCWSDQLPANLAGIYDAEKYKKSQDYEKTNHRFSFFSESFSFVLVLSILFLNGFAWLDEFVRQYSSNPIWIAILFFGIIGIASDIIGIPFSLYGTFVIEQKFGFNKTTAKTYIFDKIKGWLLAAIIGGGLIALIVWIYEVTGEWFWIYTWAAISAL